MIFLMYGVQRLGLGWVTVFGSGVRVGPLLFILYTSPLSTLISSLSLNHYLYADNTQLFLSFRPPDFDSSVTHLQNALQHMLLDEC